MVPEARLERTEHGVVPKGDGWFVVNMHDAAWRTHARFGEACVFEGDVRFPHFGINVHLVHPGQPNCFYHAESAQESFLVLSGECVLIVEGQERHLRAWDFVHCPPGTRHVFVGAGHAPCAILMAGARAPHDADIEYPVEPLALARQAGATQATTDPRVAYSGLARSEPCASPWPLRPRRARVRSTR